MRRAATLTPGFLICMPPPLASDRVVGVPITTRTKIEAGTVDVQGERSLLPRSGKL